MEIETPGVWDGVGEGEGSYTQKLFVRNCIKYPDLQRKMMHGIHPLLCGIRANSKNNVFC